jgi:predicted NBD/HSP70 family sugar kinase
MRCGERIQEPQTPVFTMPTNLKILVIDIGGTNVKVLATGQKERRRFPSGSKMTPRRMVAGIRKLVADWEYDVVSIGYPGIVVNGRISQEPYNLASGWSRFNFRAAFKRPVRIINDAAMQALGSYRKGTMLFVGLGTGLGSALVAQGVVVPMELAHLPYKKATYEDYLGARGLEQLGRKKWQRHVENCMARLISAFQLDDVVLGGGNAKELVKMPEGCRAGDNGNAFLGGFRLWEAPPAPSPRRRKTRPRPLTRRPLPRPKAHL